MRERASKYTPASEARKKAKVFLQTLCAKIRQSLRLYCQCAWITRLRWENTQKVSQTNIDVARSEAGKTLTCAACFCFIADWVQPEFIDFLGKAKQFWHQFTRVLFFRSTFSCRPNWRNFDIENISASAACVYHKHGPCCDRFMAMYFRIFFLFSRSVGPRSLRTTTHRKCSCGCRWHHPLRVLSFGRRSILAW